MYPINLSTAKVFLAIRIARAGQGESRGSARRENRAVENSLLSDARISLFRRARCLPVSLRPRAAPRAIARVTILSAPSFAAYDRPFDGSRHEVAAVCLSF